MSGESIRVSLMLQDLAHGIDNALESVAGERIPFVLVLADAGASHCCGANLPRYRLLRVAYGASTCDRRAMPVRAMHACPW